jgi:uncharacterized protein YqhQ
MSDRAAYGGQAVIEGVMIRGKAHVATSCRQPDGTIVVRHDLAESVAARQGWLKLAFLRGTPALIDSVRLGYRTLMWSADMAMAGEPEVKKPTPLQYILTVLFSVAFSISLFVLFPSWLTEHVFPVEPVSTSKSLWAQFIPSPKMVIPNIIEGIIRVLMLVGYILAISLNKEIRRVFAFHGAEHKVVNAYEAGAPLTVEGARPYSRIHPRCGTSFLFLFFIVGILVHAMIGWPDNTIIRLLSRLLLLPIIAGIAYELIRLAGRFRNSLILRTLVWPGLAMQRLTTAEPTDDQIEVATFSLRAVLEREGVWQPEAPATVELVPPAWVEQPVPA